MEQANAVYATGRRKTAVARTWLKPGSGKITVNDKPAQEYFTVPTNRIVMEQPLMLADLRDAYDIMITVKGGGASGQAGAVRHGITRALLKINPDFRKAMKKAGFITRDPRQKERKKYGQKAARARFQFSKR